MKITHISAGDFSGGAARAAFRLHAGLRQMGVDSRMFVERGESSDETVITYSRKGLPRRLLHGLRNRLLSREIGWYQLRQPIGESLFSDDRTAYRAAPVRQVPAADLLNLHWVAGFVDYGSFFRALPTNLPLVWTLHDMNPFTGGCHHAGACDSFEHRCGACPQLDSKREEDPSRAIWKRKQRAYAGVASGRLHVVTPSRWLAGQVRRSALFGSRPVSVIPYGLDTEVFQPRDRLFARQLFGIPANAKVVLFVAVWLEDRQKGFFLLPRALEVLGGDPDLYLVSIGRTGENNVGPGRHIALPYTSDERALSCLYSAADVFLLPTFADNFPNTALEALACGVPVVAFCVGGVPEIVRDGVTGLLAEPGNAEGLGRVIGEILGNPQRRRTMSENCRRVAVEEYALQIQAKRYLELYRDMLGQGGICANE